MRRGQGLVEYGLMLALVALIAAAVLILFPGQVAFVLEAVQRAMGN